MSKIHAKKLKQGKNSYPTQTPERKDFHRTHTNGVVPFVNTKNNFKEHCELILKCYFGNHRPFQWSPYEIRANLHKLLMQRIHKTKKRKILQDQVPTLSRKASAKEHPSIYCKFATKG